MRFHKTAHLRFTSAFTLVEILIAMSLIAVFITAPVLAYANYNRTQRDIKRRSDIDQLQQALTQYKATKEAFPPTDSLEELVESGYLPKMPEDPTNGEFNNGAQYQYSYESDGLSYTLSALLENKDRGAQNNQVSYYVVSDKSSGTIVNRSPADGPPREMGGFINTPIPTNALLPSKTGTPPHSPTKTRTPSPSSPPPPFVRVIGGPGEDTGGAGVQTSDGGYILTGTTSSSGAGQTDILVVKLSSNGTVEWSNTYGSTNAEEGVDIIETSDGGYLVVGTTRSYGTVDRNGYLVKLATDGSITWTRIYDGGTWSTINDVKEASGGYVITGSVNSGIGYIAKFSTDGTLSWSRAYIESDGFYAIQVLPNGSLIAAGYTQTGNQDSLLLLTDSTGDSTWAKTYDLNGLHDVFNDVIPVSNGYLAVGRTEEPGKGTDGYIVATNNSGDILWSKTGGGANDDELTSVVELSDGSFIAGGYANAQGLNGVDSWVIKIASNRDITWSKYMNTDISDASARRMKVSKLGVGTAKGNGVFFVSSANVSNHQVLALRVDSTGTISNCTDFANLAITDSEYDSSADPFETALANNGTVSSAISVVGTFAPTTTNACN